MNQHPVWPLVEELQPRFHALSDAVWAVPETCYAETKSAALHVGELEHQGFRVERNVAGIPTAMMGEWGTGGPVVAFLGEYDALAALSQEADVAEPRPLEEGANGHGCGHNLLGSAAMLAATAVRDWLRATGTEGRVRYYGCPAEEGGSAKAFMVKAGVFDDVGRLFHGVGGNVLCRVDGIFGIEAHRNLLKSAGVVPTVDLRRGWRSGVAGGASARSCDASGLPGRKPQPPNRPSV